MNDVAPAGVSDLAGERVQPRGTDTQSGTILDVPSPLQTPHGYIHFGSLPIFRYQLDLSLDADLFHGDVRGSPKVEKTPAQ